MDDIYPRLRTTEKISTTPMHVDVAIQHVREPSLFSRIDANDLDHNLASRQFSEVSLGLGRNTTISAAERSFKHEEYIYVRYLFLFPPDPQILYHRLNLRKETNGTQSISLDAKNGLSQLWHVVGHI